MKFKNETEATPAMMSSDAEWPGLVLPLKNRTRKDSRFPNVSACGYMLNPAAMTEGKVRIRLGNIFHMLEDDPEEVYETVEAAVAAGWVVD